MFPILGILVAAGLLFKLRKPKAPTSTLTATPKVPATPAKSSAAATASSKKAAPTKPAKKAGMVVTGQAAGTTGAPVYIPTATDRLNDILGQATKTNPQVLNPYSLYGSYNPATNTAGMPSQVPNTPPYRR